VSQKKPAGKPVWTKNTFFWIAGVLVLLAILGIVFGDKAIRDPGQKVEKIPLFILYTVAAIVMAVNGVLSHRQTLQQHAEETGETN
jgi:xanthosine utilization system XapX-like protein